MNKRFEDLMYQSGLTAQGSWDSMDWYDQKAIESFAEFIVRECANVALREDHEPDECILRHFGVKRSDELERFAELIRAEEREACAQVCEDLIGTRAMARHCADSIRARGEK